MSANFHDKQVWYEVGNKQEKMVPDRMASTELEQKFELFFGERGCSTTVPMEAFVVGCGLFAILGAILGNCCGNSQEQACTGSQLQTYTEETIMVRTQVLVMATFFPGGAIVAVAARQEVMRSRGHRMIGM